MRPWIASVLALLVAAFGACTPSSSEGGGGGPGGTGGAGGAADLEGPALVIESPSDGDAVAQPIVLIRGTASDEAGVRTVRWTLGSTFGTAAEGQGATEVPFSFEVFLAPGENLLQLEATDEAGNRTARILRLEFANPESQPPVIETFTADRYVVEQGEKVALSWRVTGTWPIELQLYAIGETGDSFAVTGRTGIEHVVTAPDRERLTLVATNGAGRVTSHLSIGVGADLRLFPARATIAPGQRQRIGAENAEVEWSVTGGEVVELWSIFEKGHAFRANEPGVYVLEATTRDARKGTIEITVAEQAPRLSAFRGLGGQFGAVNGWRSASAVIDDEGTLWVPVPFGVGLGRFRPADGFWTFAGDGDTGTLSSFQAAPGGGFYALRNNVPVRISADGAIVEHLATPWDENTWVWRLQCGPDGTLYAVTGNWGEPSVLWAMPPGGSFVALGPPAGAADLVLAAVAFVPEGLAIAGKNAAGDTVVFRQADAGWEELEAPPRPADPIDDFLAGPDGRLYLAGTTVAEHGPEGWIDRKEGLPVCVEGHLCGVFDLALRSDGRLLAAGRANVHALEADGTFSTVGESIEPMEAMTTILGALRSVAEAPDGTLYAAGDLGVYRLGPTDVSWSIVGGDGMVPTAGANEIVYMEDGAWILGSGGWAGQPGQHSLWRRDQDGSWIGFGNEAGNVHFPELVGALELDEAGNLYGLTTWWGDGFRIDAGSGEIESLPWDERIAQKELKAFGVAADGTVFVVPDPDRSWTVLKLLPGASNWTVEPGLFCAIDFERDPEGNLWAAGCPYLGVFRLAKGSSTWESSSAGLPRLGVEIEDLAVDEAGRVLVASWQGVYRREPGDGATFEPLGFGEPSAGAERVTSLGGRTYAATDEGVHELQGEVWVPVEAPIPMYPWTWSLFEATPDGRLLIGDDGGIGLIQGD